MGMAASQARFLQLTARRTNIEYMGQQINQQRLALANASAGLFEKMLSMVPPTPPSSQDDKYFTQGYKFTDPADGVQKSISWKSGATINTEFNSAIQTNDLDITGVNATSLTFTDTQLASAAAGGTGPSTHDIAVALGVNVTSAQQALGYTEVIRTATITHDVYNPDGELETISKTGPVLLVFDNLNRLLSFTDLNPADNTIVANNANSSSAVKTVGDGEKLTYGGTFDSVSYNDDMNQYEFQKAAYDYQVEKINQETRQIQAQDKSLELKMKQLDTEHNAVQTEMDAVQKVLQKNIEGSFKTFA